MDDGLKRSRLGRYLTATCLFQAARRQAAKLLTKDEARRIAANFAKLPELLKKL